MNEYFIFEEGLQTLKASSKDFQTKVVKVHFDPYQTFSVQLAELHFSRIKVKSSIKSFSF